MTVLAATDLDRTLIYSRKARTLGSDEAASVCVEVHDGAQVSFMTTAAADALTELATRVAVAPVTTRILDQYRRVRLPGPPPKYAVVANGGVLLVDDVPDRGWARHIERSLTESVPLDEVWTHVGNVCHADFTVKLRNASGLFCYAVVRPSRVPEGFVADLSAWAAERGWRTSLQGRKLYWVPDRLTKSAAVAEVAARLSAELVLAAGDSLLDVDLLLGADRGIRPAHGELHDQGWTAPHVTTTTASGIAAGAEIVNWFSIAAASPVRA